MITGKRIAFLFCAAISLAAWANVAQASGEQRWIPGVPRLLWSGGPQTAVVFAMTTFDDGSGPALYVGGQLFIQNQLPQFGLGRWNGQLWSVVGTGFEGWVTAMTVFDDGSGPALYVAGEGLRLSKGPNLRLAKWDGKNWTGLDLHEPNSKFSPSIFALQAYSDGRTNSLYAAGQFDFGSWDLDGIARWNGSAWERVGQGLSLPSDPQYVQGTSLAVHDDGSGPQLYVCGYFDHAGGVETGFVARWNGRAWSATGPWAPLLANSMTTYIDESNNVWLLAVWSNAHRVSAWNGKNWSEPFQNGLLIYNPGAIAQLQVGNKSKLFLTDQYYGCSQWWDGSQWQLVGSLITGNCSGAFSGGALASFDDGSTVGPALFVGGKVDVAGGYLTGGVARWGVPKNPACPADIHPNGGDARVDIDDLVRVITGWGTCGGPCNGGCIADITGNCIVDVDDLVQVITRWGPQPNSVWVSDPCPF